MKQTFPNIALQTSPLMQSALVVQGLRGPPEPPDWQAPAVQCSPAVVQSVSTRHCTHEPGGTEVSQKLPEGSFAQSPSLPQPEQWPETQLLFDVHWVVDRHSTQVLSVVSQ
jgi:hypothetical protein